MAASVIWLDAAKDDVRAILHYIAADNRSAAISYVAGLTEACNKLSDFPNAGRRYNDNFRRITFRNHVIFYRFNAQANKVSIAGVIDGRRDIEKLIDERS